MNQGSLVFSSRRRHTRFDCDWSSDVCSSDLQEWPAKSDTRGDFTVKDKFGGANGEGEVGQIEEPLNRAGTRIGMPQGLDKSPETAHQHRLGIREVQDADENKQEIR